MNAMNLKETLQHIANKVDDSTSIEDIFKELSLLADVEESERQEEKGETFSQKEVEAMAKKWVK